MLKKSLLVAFLLTFTHFSYGASIEQECTNLVLDYAYYRDRPEPEAFANVFAEDAVLTVGADSWTGRAAIRERLNGAENGPKYRHLMSTIRIFPVDENHATGVSYVTVYNAPKGATTVEGFAAIGEYHDEFVRTDEGWKIQSRRFVAEFRYADENAQ